MLISRVTESDGGTVEDRVEAQDEEDHSHEYQTANDLFELMAKNQNFHSNDVESITTRDLVLLYKNIDLGTKLMSSANELKLRRPNQYVETVVYNDDPESDSDVSEIYSYEDLRNVVLINKERIDLLASNPSVENTLCHKFGDLEIQSSDITTEYNRQFLFKDPYIKEQLKSLNLVSNNNSEYEGTVLPASLLDYICCKRLEDNYNFYMENIIRYVKHTIEQLKRISNGDYLTDKAKEKWREVEHDVQDISGSSNTKVLTTSTSIPLHVERKDGGLLSTWDDLVHSEVDVRSLSKILEKKIILEVPKLICGSYKLMSKCCAENVIISCQKETLPVKKLQEESSVNVYFQLQRSETGCVVSNISSIMILQTSTSKPCDSRGTDPLPLTYDIPVNIGDDSTEDKKTNIKIIELVQTDDENPNGFECSKLECGDKSKDNCSDHWTEDSVQDSVDYPYSDDGNISTKDQSNQDSSGSSDVLRDILDKKGVNINKEASFKLVSPDELRVTMQRLNVQSTLPEESGEDVSPNTSIKKRSPRQVRIKSPYENKSFLIEEKKRRKLLEIRERREKKKMALAENCKITKHRYGKGFTMPQPTTSVTKLSITNKSFYNSIYGHSSSFDHKNANGKNRKGKKDGDLEVTGVEEETRGPLLTPDRNSKKYTNRSYYLDDAVTEMMYLEMKHNKKKVAKEACSASTSEASNDFHANLNLLSQLIGPSVTDFGAETIGEEKVQRLAENASFEHEDQKGKTKDLAASQSIANVLISSSPPDNTNNDLKNDPKKSSSSVECRKSINKVYDLLKKLKPENTEIKLLQTKFTGGNDNAKEKSNMIGTTGSSTFQGSDSGTSVKHHLTSSNPSYFSFEKINNPASIKLDNTQHNKKPESPNTVVPKVIISSKSQLSKFETEKCKKDRKKVVINLAHKTPDNPLKAISQLLHEFENVQKNRQKSATEQKSFKKLDNDVTADGKIGSHQNPAKRRSRLDQHLKDNDILLERSPKVVSPKDKVYRPLADIARNPHQHVIVEDKNMDKSKKKMVDIINEVKEARGEAVRGPSKFNSRLNSLAQPKRSYVQAHSEEYQTKYGRNLMSDRLQRLAAVQSPNKGKRSEPMSTISVKLPSSPVPPLERAARYRRSANNSPDTVLSPGRGSSKKTNVPDTPETLMKKMVAVESYVKTHYGRTSPSPMTSVPMARVPLLPTDLESASLTSSPNEESTVLGSKLHRIIDTMINTTSAGLSVLPECHESRTSKLDSENFFPNENSSKCDGHTSTDSEYNVDIFEDKNVRTAVENIDKVIEKQVSSEHNNDLSLSCNIQTINPTSQLEKLENALFQQMSVGTFQKRLRIKNFTLTPKQSMQQVVVLQSGDAGSLLIKSTVSQNLKISKSTTEELQQVKTLPVLSKTHLDWSFANFPVQVATVGYAFPRYKSVQIGSKSVKLINGKTTEKNINECHPKSDKDCQCFKGKHMTVTPPLKEITMIVDQKEPSLLKVVSETNIISQEPKEPNEIKVNKEMDEKKVPDITNKSELNSQEQPVCCTNELIKPSNKYIPQTTIPTVDKNIVVTNDCNDVDYTTSLDMLVGLLNEIKKITTCQTQIATADERHATDHEYKELETILNNAADAENSVNSNPHETVSVTSLEKFRQLESNPSLYSFFLSNNEETNCLKTSHKRLSKITLNPEIATGNSVMELSPKPLCVDKEVTVNFEEREFVNTFTEVPSKFLPIAVNHSTNVTNSLIEVISQPSTQSMFSFTEYHTIYSNTPSLKACTNIIELPEVCTEDFPSSPSQGLTNYLSYQELETINNVNVKEKLHKKKIEAVQKVVNIKQSLKINKRYIKTTGFDPLMKMKRDILVTVYSILVLTVFVALSFPQVLYHI